jgi:NAD+ synthase (glutamine-hydrolysing)
MERETKFAVAQMEVKAGHPDLNFAKMVEETNRARDRKVDVIVFPEMSVSGYLLGDEWENDSFIRDLMEYNQMILHESEGIAVIWGNVQADFSKKNEDGRTRKYNAVHVAQNGRWVDNGIFKGHSYKTLMPKYREFDDERHFHSMIKLALEMKKPIEKMLMPFPLKVAGGRLMIGAMLCEDMWIQDYNVNPSAILAKNGAEVFVNLSASPWSWRKNDKRHRVVRELLSQSRRHFVYANNVGTQNNGKNIFVFDGASTVYNSDGSLMKSSEPYKEETIDFSLPNKNSVRVAEREPYDKEDTVELHKAIVYGIRKFMESFASKKIIIGVSGGVDSALSASLLVEAVGPKNVIGINMPSVHNKDLTRNAARELAENLGIDYKVIPIQDSVDLTVKQLRDAGFVVDDFPIENIQARDRGSRVLSGVAAVNNAIFVNNGNKTEVAFGYATLYGDVNGAVATLADIYKGEVYDLARYKNEMAGGYLIPKNSIDVVPSAELSAKQDVTKGLGDPLIYPYHDKLARAFIEFRFDPEHILELYAGGKLESTIMAPKGIVRKNFPSHELFIRDLEKWWTLFKINYFKRIQGPPIISVSRRAFGYDLRESQNGVYYTMAYKKLKGKLLGKTLV